MTRQTPDLRLTGTRVDFTFDIADVEPLPLPYGSTRFIPTKVMVTLHDGAAPTSVKVAGPNAKKDGSVGQNWHEANYYLDFGEDRNPDWLPDVIALAVNRWADMDNAARVAEGNHTDD
jgi:hypothetical protein